MSELVPFADTPVQAVFDWDATVAETKELVKEDAELTSTIDEAMIRRFEVRVRIGQNLSALQAEHSKNRHGDFTTVELPKLGIDRVFAHRCIRVAKLYENPIVSRVKRLDFPRLPMNTWNQLASPSTPRLVVEQVVSGEIEPTSSIINAEIIAAKEAQRKAEEKASEAQAQLRLFEEQDLSRRSEVTHLSMQIKALEQQIAAHSAQASIPPETTAQLEKLQSDLKERTSDLKERTKERDNLAKVREEQRQSLEEYRNANRAAREQELYETRVKQNLQQITDAFQRAVTPLLAQFPSVFDVQVFDHQDWSRLDHAIEVVQRFLAECERLRARPTALIIDAG